MSVTSDWISSRTFVPGKLPGFLWRVLRMFAPITATPYLDFLIRCRVHAAQHAQRADGPLTLLGAFSLNIGIARAAQILCAGLEAAGQPVYPMDCSAVLRPI